MTTYDISSIQVSDTYDIEVINPGSGEPMTTPMETVTDPASGETRKVPGKPLTITVYGPGSKTFKAAQAVSQRAHVDTFKRGKSKETPDQTAARQSRFLASCTVSFNNFGYQGMEPGFEMFRQCYLDPKMGWLFEQVNQELGDWGNFTKDSSTN